MQLLRSPLVQTLEPAFQSLLDDLASARGWPTSRAPAKVGALVRELSLSYNDPRCAPPRTADALAARLLFSFPRDVPKGAAAVRELVSAGALSFEEKKTLRVLDLGAGLGATSRGVARALAATGASGQLSVDAFDSDKDALALAASIARARPREGRVDVVLRVATASVTEVDSSGPYDVIVLGQLLSELDVDGGDERPLRHASLLARLGSKLAPDGSLVVIEPALRERTRHLHAVRDLALGGASGFNVFAPCGHDAPCPMRVTNDDWCHEDVDTDLPGWLVPVARAAGLRWQGLTFSYLVLRRDGRRFTGPDRGTESIPLRVVSSPVVTKGKRELFVCGRPEGAVDAVQMRLMRLDRHRSEGNDALGEAARGDVLRVAPPPEATRPRVEMTTVVQRVTGAEAAREPPGR